MRWQPTPAWATSGCRPSCRYRCCSAALLHWLGPLLGASFESNNFKEECWQLAVLEQAYTHCLHTDVNMSFNPCTVSAWRRAWCGAPSRPHTCIHV